ncbi:hypothetical protein BJV82DRAFT_610429, partial [Fennellomyces sp. T-0311]
MYHSLFLTSLFYSFMNLSSLLPPPFHSMMQVKGMGSWEMTKKYTFPWGFLLCWSFVLSFFIYRFFLFRC